MRRSAYTLVEVLLALSIAVLLLGALYVAVDTQLRMAQAARDKVEQSTVPRVIFNRMDQDAVGVISQPDTARFRYKQSSSSSGSGSSGASTSGSSSSGASTSGSSSSSSSIASMSTTGTISTYTNSTGVEVIILPYGVIGDEQTLNMFVSRVPREMINAQLQQQEGSGDVAGDVRRISYWLGDGGLSKQEVKLATADDSGAIDQSVLPPNVDPSGKYPVTVLAQEVKSLQFQYFDPVAQQWTPTWDSTQPGADGITPLGSPAAVQVTLTIAQVGKPDSAPRQYQHVIVFATANGGTPMPTPSSSSTTGGGTTSP